MEKPKDPVFLPTEALFTKDGELLEVKKLLKVGGSWAYIVPKSWLDFYGFEMSSVMLVKVSIEKDTITIKALSLAEREAVEERLG
jgi:hypothetical protein